MGYWYEREEQPDRIVITFTRYALSMALFWVLDLVAIVFLVGAPILEQWWLAVPGGVCVLAAFGVFRPYRAVGAEIRAAMHGQGVHSSGSKWSLSNPLILVIAKEQGAATDNRPPPVPPRPPPLP